MQIINKTLFAKKKYISFQNIYLLFEQTKLIYKQLTFAYFVLMSTLQVYLQTIFVTNIIVSLYLFPLAIQFQMCKLHLHTLNTIFSVQKVNSLKLYIFMLPTIWLNILYQRSKMSLEHLYMFHFLQNAFILCFHIDYSPRLCDAFHTKLQCCSDASLINKY